MDAYLWVGLLAGAVVGALMVTIGRLTFPKVRAWWYEFHTAPKQAVKALKHDNNHLNNVISGLENSIQVLEEERDMYRERAQDAGYSVLAESDKLRKEQKLSESLSKKLEEANEKLASQRVLLEKAARRLGAGK